MATAEAGEGREVQPPELGPRTRRSTATRYMAAAAGGVGEEERHRLYILGLPVSVPLPVAISLLDAGVPRKARTSRPRAKPSGWWAFRLPVPLPKGPPEEGTRSPNPQRMRVLCLEAPSPSDPTERPAKKARRCVQCGSAETPQWRSGPLGRSTLCNACGVRLRAAGALRETEHRSPPAKVAEKPPPPPPGSPPSDSPPDSPICERRAPPGEVYLVRKQPKREKRTPQKEAAAPVSSSPAIYLVKKKKPSKKPWRPRNTGQSCLHCGTTSTPQWREGPMGRHTLCNACGVRYRQGRLLPEYRPAASPTFVPSEHASRHREVLQLHRQQQQSKQPHRKQQPKPVDEDNILLLDRCVGDAPGSDEDDKNNVFLLRRQPVDRYPPTPLHRPLSPPVEEDPRVSSNNNGSNAGAVARCGGVDDKTGVLGSAAGCGRSSDKAGVLGSAAGCGGGNDQTNVPSSAAGCGGGDDHTGALDSLLLDGPSAPLIVDSNEFVVSQ